jgi:hypothetical protein
MCKRYASTTLNNLPTPTLCTVQAHSHTHRWDLCREHQMIGAAAPAAGAAPVAAAAAAAAVFNSTSKPRWITPPALLESMILQWGGTGMQPAWTTHSAALPCTRVSAAHVPCLAGQLASGIESASKPSCIQAGRGRQPLQAARRLLPMNASLHGGKQSEGAGATRGAPAAHCSTQHTAAAATHTVANACSLLLPLPVLQLLMLGRPNPRRRRRQPSRNALL